MEDTINSVMRENAELRNEIAKLEGALKVLTEFAQKKNQWEQSLIDSRRLSFWQVLRGTRPAYTKERKAWAEYMEAKHKAIAYVTMNKEGEL